MKVQVLPSGEFSHLLAEPGTTSRALVVHARTLEFYRQMGLADAFLAEALPFGAVNLWVGGR